MTPKGPVLKVELQKADVAGRVAADPLVNNDDPRGKWHIAKGDPSLTQALFRIGEWGITPNRMAVLGGNILLLINLFIVALRLLQTLLYHKPVQAVEESIARFLPMYAAWTCIVVFLFPLLFQFR